MIRKLRSFFGDILWDIFVRPLTWPFAPFVLFFEWRKLRRLTLEKARLEREANERADAEIASLEAIQREVQ